MDLGKVSSRKVVHFKFLNLFLLCRYFILGTTPLVQQNVNFSLTDSNLAEAMNSLKNNNKEMDPLLLCFWHFHDIVLSDTSMRVRWERQNTFETICLLLLEIVSENCFGTSLCCVYCVLPQALNESLLSDLSFLGMDIFHCDFFECLLLLVVLKCKCLVFLL